MSTFLLTLALAMGLILLGLLSLSIGWLLTGKSKIRPGACGKNPQLKKGCEEDQSCSLCDHEKK